MKRTSEITEKVTKQYGNDQYYIRQAQARPSIVTESDVTVENFLGKSWNDNTRMSQLSKYSYMSQRPSIPEQPYSQPKAVKLNLHAIQRKESVESKPFQDAKKQNQDIADAL